MPVSVPYQLDFRSVGNELHVAMRGDERNVDKVVACWMQIASEVRKRNATRVLAITHIVGEPLPAQSISRFMENLGGLGLEDVRIAYVDIRGFKTPLMETAEILASEHGFSVRIFDAPIAAEMWLRHGGN
jgi:hypothetical protein